MLYARPEKCFVKIIIILVKITILSRKATTDCKNTKKLPYFTINFTIQYSINFPIFLAKFLIKYGHFYKPFFLNAPSRKILSSRKILFQNKKDMGYERNFSFTFRQK